MPEEQAGLLWSRAERVLPLIFDVSVAQDGEHGPRRPAQAPSTAAAFLSATPSPRFLLYGPAVGLPVALMTMHFGVRVEVHLAPCASRSSQRLPVQPCFVCCFLLSERLHLRSAGAIGMTSKNKGCVFGALECALSAIIYRAVIALVPLIRE